MPKRTFEQKWEELRREGKLKDMIAESQQDFERSQAVEPPEVEVTAVQQAVPAQAGRGTPTSSRFAQEVLARSRAALSARATAVSDDPNPDPFHNFDEPSPGDEDDKPEADVQDSDGDELEVALGADATVNDTGDDDVDEVDHRTAAPSSKHMLMDDVLNENLPWADRPDKRCVLCLSDDTVDNDMKDKEYIGIEALRKHMHGNFHSGLARLQRLVTNAFNMKPSLGYHCPYCITVYKEAYPDYDEFAEEGLLGQATRGYVKLEGVVQHVRNSTKENTSARHEELKELDGWNDEGFHETTTEAARTLDRRARTRNRLRLRGIELPQPLPVMESAVDHKTNPGILCGDFAFSGEIPEEYQQTVEYGPVSAKATVLPGYEGELAVGTAQDAGLFDFDQGEIAAAPLPSTLLGQTLAKNKKRKRTMAIDD